MEAALVRTRGSWRAQTSESADDSAQVADDEGGMAGHGRESIHGSSHACGMKLMMIYDHDYHIHHYKFKDFFFHPFFFFKTKNRTNKWNVMLYPVHGGRLGCWIQWRVVLKYHGTWRPWGPKRNKRWPKKGTGLVWSLPRLGKWRPSIGSRPSLAAIGRRRELDRRKSANLHHPKQLH